MARLLKRIALVLFFVVVASIGLVMWFLHTQGAPDGYWDHYTDAKVVFDQHGIPTIEAASMVDVVKTQGMLVASERLWQMDLIRRKSGGRLSEWFGEVAFEHDKTVRLEDREGVAERAYKEMDDKSRAYCDAYATGVNRFIAEFRGRWGVEYDLLQTEPEDWSCKDSLLVVLEMAEILTSTAASEAEDAVWRKHLSESWYDFLYTLDHPWNKPLFGEPPAGPPALPPKEEYLPQVDLPESIHDVIARWARVSTLREREPVGSNNWAYRGKKGWFLANDPHLGQGVPSIWYALRLRTSPSDWIVGVSIPGLPGIVLGMNRHIAWAFTNTGEDVDDYVKETVSADGSSYLTKSDDGTEEWRPFTQKSFSIKVKGEVEPRIVEGKFTERGPVAERQHLEGLYSRMWAPLQPGILRLPVIDIMQSNSIDAMFTAIDSMTTPTQNVLIMDRAGVMAYRASGRGIKRQMSGLLPTDANDGGAWEGFEDTSERRRLKIELGAGEHQYLATANERIWRDDYGHHWFGEDRKNRIMRFLAARDDYTLDDMLALQNDTEARFRKTLLLWVAAAYEGNPELIDPWRSWDGTSRGDPIVFRQSTLVERYLVDLLLGRLREEVGVPKDYRLKAPIPRAWLLSLMESEDGLQAFGFDRVQVARYLVDRVDGESAMMKPHHEDNAFGGQHPFVKTVPVLGKLFTVKEYPQYGAFDLVLAEQKTFGPSVRLLWNMQDPASSRWIFPVGQSGHVRSKHYRDAQKAWFGGEAWAVFDEKLEWVF